MTQNDHQYSSGTNAAGLPRLPLNLRDHKLAIAIPWTLIILSSGILPIIGYFAIHYGVPSASLTVVLSPWLSFMGVTSVFSLLKRTWDLFKTTSNCRPLGQNSRWGLDYFCWNFTFGFVVLTIIISLGIALENLTIVSLPLSILMLYVSLQLVLVPGIMAAGLRAPIRFSSVAKGEMVRPGSFVITEDVVAVDGKQGQAWRRAWSERYEASPVMREFLKKMDLLWGCSGLVVVAVIWGLVFGVEDKEIGYAVGWSLPWVWAGAMTMLTIRMAKGMLREEGQRGGQPIPA